MKKILVIVGGFFLFVVVASTIAILTFDINKHRDQIEAALSKETGRSVKFGGKIDFGLSLKGLTLAIHDVSFGNPSWASRPDMAKVKTFDLKVGVLPLLAHHIDIKGLVIEDADILLESQNENRHNWDMAQTAESPKPNGKQSGGASPVDINIASLSVVNSRISTLDADHKMTTFKADKLTLGAENSGVGLHFLGSFNTIPIKLSAQSNGDSLLSQASRPISFDLEFANYFFSAKGKVSASDKKAVFDHYEFSAGKSKVEGSLKLAWGGVRPEIVGSLTGDQLDPADFKMENPNASDADDANAVETSPSPRVFSDAPLPFAALRSANVLLDVAVAGVTSGSVELKNIKAKLSIKDGRLAVSPMMMKLGDGTITGQVNVDASAVPARFSSELAVNDVDISDLIKVWGAEAFLSGKVKADVTVASVGNSMHELASNLNGPITIIGAGGDVLTTASNKISEGIASILSPGGGGNQGMNCVVARYLAQNGVIRSNGVLIDTSAATMAGYGDADLRSETLNMEFHAKPKLIGVGGFLPSLHIGGTLKKPDVGASAKSLVQNVGSLLTGGGASDPVPDVMTQQGQNACAYALDHPTVAPTGTKSGVVQDLAGKAGGLIKGLFGQ